MEAKNYTVENYPNISLNGMNGEYIYETIIRVKRNGVWYDVPVRYFSESKNAMGTFKEKLVLTKKFWMPIHEESEMAKSIGKSMPSENQDDTEDDLTK